MEASALQHAAHPSALVGRSPLLRLQGDEKLIALIRRGNDAAFEALVQRYQPRLLAFCRHMLNSNEDAEDVLQEVFAAAFNAICADERPINARPWLYRIARNRCLNHLRRPVPAGQDSMDVFERDGGTTTADTVHKREEFRQIVTDVQGLPETQRTALLLREIDALSYDQIAEAMETTVPSVKSLLVRARVSLAEAAEARLLTCAEVRLELGQAAEGLARSSAPVRRHVRSCDRCTLFRGELRRANRALAAIYPIGPLVVFKKLLFAKVGAGAAAGGAATAGGSGIAGTASVAGGAVGATAAGGAAAGGAISAGVSAVASKAAAGLAAAAIVTAGAVEVKRVKDSPASPEAAVPAQVAVAPPAPRASVVPQPVASPPAREPEREPAKAAEKPAVAPERPKPAPKTASPPPPAEQPVVQPPADQGSSTVTLPHNGRPTSTGPEPVAPAPPAPTVVPEPVPEPVEAPLEPPPGPAPPPAKEPPPGP